MAYCFGDGFDLYAATTDAAAGYWDSFVNGAAPSLVAGRFTGSQCWRWGNTGGVGSLTKISNVNDGVHHFVFAMQQNTAALSGTTVATYLQLLDGTTGQCAIGFRSDGAMVLASGTSLGTVLDTYTGAVTAANTWFAFEIEIVIHNTAGSWTVRKNGNTSNDWTRTGLNTRGGTANNYANRLTFGGNAAGLNYHMYDDILWRSDAASVPWVGDIRCYTRMPASDVTAQFSRAPASTTLTPFVQGNTQGITNGVARYGAFTPTLDGTVSSISLSIATGYTGNLKASIFSSSAGLPGTVLGSATTISNPVSGANTLTFGTPVSVTKGTQYFFGYCADASTGTVNVTSAAGVGLTTTMTYAAFPAANPGATASYAPIFTVTLGVSSNATLVAEAQQDGTTSYVYDSTVGHADLYAIASLSGTPASVVAVTTRGFIQKSDAGTRNGAVQLKSGATTVQSTSTALSTSFGWLYRTDTTDPATGTAWTATAVNNLGIGPVVVS